MKSFNVINYNFNKNKFEAYNVIPYLIECYKHQVEQHKKYPKVKYWDVPVTFEEFKKFIIDQSMYKFWSRCEYEIILVDWPCQKHEEKWDIHSQIMMNLDIITEIIIKQLKNDCR